MRLSDYNSDKEIVYVTPPRARRKQVVFRLLVLLLFVVGAVLFLLLALDDAARDPGSLIRYDATATVFSATATAFAGTFLTTGEPENNLALPAVEATSTQFFQELQTAQPLLFDDVEQPVVTVTPEMP